MMKDVRSALVTFVIASCMTATSPRAFAQQDGTKFSALAPSEANSAMILYAGGVRPAVIRTCKYQAADAAALSKPVLCQRLSWDETSNQYIPAGNAFWAAPSGQLDSSSGVVVKQGFILFETAVDAPTGRTFGTTNQDFRVDAASEAGDSTSTVLSMPAQQRASPMQVPLGLQRGISTDTTQIDKADQSTPVLTKRTPAPSAANVGNDGPDYSTRNQVPRSAPFGPLEDGIGTFDQRAFWRERCQNLPADSSPSAEGCRQSLEMLRKQTNSTLQQPNAPAGILVDSRSNTLRTAAPSANAPPRRAESPTGRASFSHRDSYEPGGPSGSRPYTIFVTNDGDVNLQCFVVASGLRYNTGAYTGATSVQSRFSEQRTLVVLPDRTGSLGWNAVVPGTGRYDVTCHRN